MVVRKSKKEEAERRRREQQRIFVEGLQRYKSKGIQILIDGRECRPEEYRKLCEFREDGQKCHIIVEQHLSFCTTVGFESLAQSAVICLICLPVLLCHDLLIDIYVTEHSKFSFALPDQLLLMNSLLHFGQVIQILPLPFGTRTLCLHPGHLKKR